MADALDSKGGHCQRNGSSLNRFTATHSEESASESAQELLHFCCNGVLYIDFALVIRPALVSTLYRAFLPQPDSLPLLPWSPYHEQLATQFRTVENGRI